ncbi:MAG: hypothetical protein KatS3mg033_1517 [Thermonema sp.]|nr:MAG: hypothetical protein KatS3mg033_1517 [Thermonema sp.]
MVLNKDIIKKRFARIERSAGRIMQKFKLGKLSVRYHIV